MFLFCCEKKKVKISNKVTKSAYEKTLTDSEYSLEQELKLIMESCKEKGEDAYSGIWYNLIPKMKKKYVLQTILCFIREIYDNRMNRYLMNDTNMTSELSQYLITENHRSEVYSLKVKDFKNLSKTDQQFCDVEVKCYHPHKFKKLFTIGGNLNGDLYRSFSPNSCQRIIQEIIEGQSGISGGASGEIFIISKDHRFIIKTMSIKECEVFSELLEDKGFLNYFENNTQSLITKFYGLMEFTFTNEYNMKY